MLSAKQIALRFVIAVSAMTGQLSGARADAPSAIEFFLRSDFTTTAGNYCSSEDECRQKCGGSASCERPVGMCLNCSGARSPYTMDLFANAGRSTLSCLLNPLTEDQQNELFRSSDLIPIWAISPYSPADLKDPALLKNFRRLCPEGSPDPVVVAVVDRGTRSLEEIPLVKCGASLFPLRRENEDCADQAEAISDGIRQAKAANDALEAEFESEVSRLDEPGVRYEMIRFTDYVEGQYLGCAPDAASVCKALCGSLRSCVFPVDNERNAKAIREFKKTSWHVCGHDRFSLVKLLKYIDAPDAFAFSAASLSLSYDAPIDPATQGDLGTVNAILKDFSSALDSKGSGESSFHASSAYRQSVEAKIDSLCDGGAKAYIMGRGDRVEIAFCATGKNGYFLRLLPETEACPGRGAP